MFRSFYQRWGKRCLDLILFVPAIFALAPVLLVVALAVRVCLGEPVLFWQLRSGRGGRPFWLVKFRSMTDARDSSGKLLPDERRLNAFGKLLRATSLDELPEIWNVVRGEMSFVGPRPWIAEYFEHFTYEQKQRCSARPGLTGWAQVNGRNGLTWEEKIEYDLWYVRHESARLDMSILLRTLLTLISGRGVHWDRHATMPRFVNCAGERTTMFEPPKEIYVVGAGGHGKVAIAAAHACNVRVAAVFDDDPAKVDFELRGVRVVGPVAAIKSWPALPTLIAVGDNTRRAALAAVLDLSWATIVHPTAWVDETAQLGAGVLVLANAVVQADATVGDHAIVNNNSTVEHDCRVAAGAHVASGACLAGGAEVGTGSLVGAGATLLPGAEVGDHAIVGAGAVVVNRVPDRTTAVGVPAVVVHSAAGARRVRRLRNGISHQL